MMRRKLSTILMAGVMAATLLAGCGQENTNQAPAENEAESAAAEAETSEDSETSTEDITITMMYSGTAAENDFETTVLPGLVKEHFPNITLEVTKLPDDNYYTSLKTKLASGECPDIILVQPMYAGQNAVIDLAEAGYLADLSDMEAVKLSGAGANSFSYEGKVYGIPSGVTMLGTYYNKDVFAANNLEVPKTWDEFLNCCQTLQDAGIQPIIMGDKDNYVMQFGLYQIACNEIYAKNANYDSMLRTGEATFTDKGTWDTVLQMYTTLYDRGYISSNSLGIGNAQSIQEFIDGKAAMIFDGSFNMAAVTADGAAQFERGYFPIPAVNGDTFAAVSSGAGPAIFAESKYVDECKAILELLYDGESDLYRAFVDSGRLIPTYGYGVDSLDPLYDEFMKLYNEGKAFYWCNQAWPAGVNDEMQAKLGEYIGGQATIESITEAMQAKFDELVEE